MKSETRKLGKHTPLACSVRRLAEPVCAQIVAQICNLFPQTRDRLAVGRALYFSNDFAISAVAFPLTPALSLRERENLPQPRANSNADWSSCRLQILRPEGGDETRVRTIARTPGSLFSPSGPERFSGRRRSPSPRPSPPGRGRSFRAPRISSPSRDSSQRGRREFPLLGERARVRAVQSSNCIVPAEGEGQGKHGRSRHATYGENSST